MTQAAIQIEKLSKEYLVGSFRKRRVQALRELSLTVEPGVGTGMQM